MKVVFVTPTKEKGGIGSYSKQIVKHLSRLKKIDLVEINNHSKIPRSYDILHIQHHYSFFGLPLPFFNRFNSYLKNVKPIVVVTVHDLITSPPMGLPYVARAILAYLIRILNKQSFVNSNINHLIVHSQSQLFLLNKMGVSKDKISLLPMGVPRGVDTKDDPLLTKKAWDMEGKIILTILGFIFRRKGYEIALKALKKLKNKNIVLVIAGDFNSKSLIDRDYKDVLIKYIEENKLENQVIITGYLSDEKIRELILITDVVLAPFRGNYGSPYSLSTAIGFNKPIISSDIQPVLEIQRRMKCMEIFKEGDSNDLAMKISKLLKNSDHRKKLAGRAREYSLAYGFDSLAGQHKKIYDYLIKQSELLSKNR